MTTLSYARPARHYAAPVFRPQVRKRYDEWENLSPPEFGTKLASIDVPDTCDRKLGFVRHTAADVDEPVFKFADVVMFLHDTVEDALTRRIVWGHILMQLEGVQEPIDGAPKRPAPMLTAATCFNHRVVPSYVFTAAQEWARTYGAAPLVHYKRRTVDSIRVNNLVSSKNF